MIHSQTPRGCKPMYNIFTVKRLYRWQKFNVSIVFLKTILSPKNFNTRNHLIDKIIPYYQNLLYPCPSIVCRKFNGGTKARFFTTFLEAWMLTKYKSLIAANMATTSQDKPMQVRIIFTNCLYWWINNILNYFLSA